MLGIVLVSYHSDERTVRFVRTELSRISVPHRIVVVDNGVGAGNVSPLAAFLPEADVLSADNQGFSTGNNVGASWLLERYPVSAILFTNNDIHLSSDDVVDRMYRKLQETPEIGSIGPEVIGLDGRRQSPEGYQGLWHRYVWMYLLTPFLSKERKRRLFQLDYPARAEEGGHYKISGSFFLMDVDAFRRIGMMDEHTFLYAEENILSDRLARIGKTCYFFPEVQVVHEHARTIGASYDLERRTWMQFESMSYYYHAYRGYPLWECRLVSFLFSLVLKLK